MKSAFFVSASAAVCFLLSGCGSDESEVTAAEQQSSNPRIVERIEEQSSSPVEIEIVTARIPPAPKQGETVTPISNTGQAYFEVRFTNIGTRPITKLKLKFNHPRIGLAEQTIFSDRDSLAPNKSKTRQFTIDLLEQPGEAEATISVLDWSPR